MNHKPYQEHRSDAARQTSSLQTASGAFDEETQARVTQFFGGERFNDVQIITDSTMAVQFGAHALAQDHTLHFAPGQFDPKTPAGFGLLVHELTHVRQTRRGANAELHGTGGPPALRQAMENEAYAKQAQAASAFSGLSSVPIQRACECEQCASKKQPKDSTTA